MKMLLGALAVALAATSSATAFDSQTQAAIDRYKSGKQVGITDVAHLMRMSEMWCYAEQDATCAWADIYLDVDDDGAQYEISNAWDVDTDIAFVDRGVFAEGRYICETDYDWVPSVRATRREDGGVVGGRMLFELKTAISAARVGDTQDCFDYLYISADPGLETITLLQRQYTDGLRQDGRDVEVTLHFNAEDVAGLSMRW